MGNYYQNQLASAVGQCSFCINHDKGATKWMSLNNDSATELVMWLKSGYTINEPKNIGPTWDIKSTKDIIDRALEGWELNLTEKEALKILHTLLDKYNESYGVSWDELDSVIEAYSTDTYNF